MGVCVHTHVCVRVCILYMYSIYTDFAKHFLRKIFGIYVYICICECTVYIYIYIYGNP